MFKLNKKTEYALLALRHVSQQAAGETVSAKEIAARYDIPEMLLAKVLQTLKRGGVLASTQGSAGGYRLDVPLSEVAFTQVLELFNEQTALVDCTAAAPCSCQQQVHCDIRGPLQRLQDTIMAQVRHLTLADLFEPAQPRNLSIFRLG